MEETNMKVKPLADRILVRPEPPQEVTDIGIILSDDSLEIPMRGEIVAIGRGKNINEPPQCKVGEIALYGKYAGTTLKIEGEELTILRESDIYATI